MYSHSFEGEVHPTRKNMYNTPEIVSLRNHLIELIHKDAEVRAEKETDDIVRPVYK